MIDHAVLLGVIVTLFGISMGSPFMAMSIQNRRNDRAAANLAETVTKHTDNLSLALQHELDATRLAITAITETLRLKAEAGVEALPETSATLARLQKQEEALMEEVVRRAAR